MPQIYVACLASYNNGRLHGRWIDADDADTMRDEIAEMLRESPYPNVRVKCPDCDDGQRLLMTRANGFQDTYDCPTCGAHGMVPSAEEWAVHDYDGLPSSFGEYPNLDEIATYAELYDEHGELFAVWYDHASPGADLDAEAFQEAYAGAFDSLADWAEDFLESTGGLDEMPERLRYYFDFDKYGRDADYGGDIWTARGRTGELHVFWKH